MNKQHTVLRNDQVKLQNVLVAIIGNIIQINENGELTIKISEPCNANLVQFDIVYHNAKEIVPPNIGEASLVEALNQS